MRYIDELFKDASPTATVKKIQDILELVGIEYYESWSESGIENCYSLTVSAKGGIPAANGKGVTREFAQASAYGEFIERLQGGLFFYKFQSMGREKAMDIHTFAPDARYMTVDELVENGEWMDYLIDTYKYHGLTRKTIAKQCKMYACADDGRILTLPFYSLFEKRYVYLPIAFVDQVCATNGCCAGNTKEEAWVHALSEMLERHAALKVMCSGEAAPKIPDEDLVKFPTVASILQDIRKNGDFDIDVFDFSVGSGFPVIATRIISKKSHSYRVNVAADPVYEIAIQRTLTEFFQNRHVKSINALHNGKVLAKSSEAYATNNVINQLETGNGCFAADFFANELTCSRQPAVFADNSKKTNKELLDYCLDIYKQMGKPVYVRNFSFLGFPSYRFVVPGFSEAFAVKMAAPVQEFAIADIAAKTLKNVSDATDEELNWLLMYNQTISGIYSRYNSFGRISGIPVSGKAKSLLANVTRAYASYRLKRYADTIKYLTAYNKSASIDEDTKQYFECVIRYLELKTMKLEAEKIRIILSKFFTEQLVRKLYENLDAGNSPFDHYLMCCDFVSCDSCKYCENCCYHSIKNMTARIGEVYKTFTDGQDAREFRI